jgi:O-methyltransferase
MKLATFNLSNSQFIEFCKSLIPPVVWSFLYQKLIVKDIPDAKNYAPHYSPWREKKFSSRASGVRKFTGLSAEKLYILEHFAKSTFYLDGDIAELGVWKGGGAKFIADIFRSGCKFKKTFYLFDSFEGMKKVDSNEDRHEIGDFSNTSIEMVESLMASLQHTNISVVIKQGWIPNTFSGLEGSKFSVVHIDLDLYEPIKDALSFVYPRLLRGGVLIFDDYGFASCPGARKAVDEFVELVDESLLVLATGQAVLVRAKA